MRTMLDVSAAVAEADGAAGSPLRPRGGRAGPRAVRSSPGPRSARRRRVLVAQLAHGQGDDDVGGVADGDPAGLGGGASGGHGLGGGSKQGLGQRQEDLSGLGELGALRGAVQQAGTELLPGASPRAAGSAAPGLGLSHPAADNRVLIGSRTRRSSQRRENQ